mgnify:CR=1 FL=1
MELGRAYLLALDRHSEISLCLLFPRFEIILLLDLKGLSEDSGFLLKPGLTLAACCSSRVLKLSSVSSSPALRTRSLSTSVSRSLTRTSISACFLLIFSAHGCSSFCFFWISSWCFCVLPTIGVEIASKRPAVVKRTSQILLDLTQLLLLNLELGFLGLQLAAVLLERLCCILYVVFRLLQSRGLLDTGKGMRRLVPILVG